MKLRAMKLQTAQFPLEYHLVMDRILLTPRRRSKVGLDRWQKRIPYLDWGLHQGQDWIRDGKNGGPFSPKKHG